jgi:DNA polymerase alpha-associated DNA helicase A
MRQHKQWKLYVHALKFNKILSLSEYTDGFLQVCWIPIFKAKKLILAGDPRQLPPTILSLDKKRKDKEKKAIKKPTKKLQSVQKNELPPGPPSSSSESEEDNEDVIVPPTKPLKAEQSYRVPLRLIPPRTL